MEIQIGLTLFNLVFQIPALIEGSHFVGFAGNVLITPFILRKFQGEKGPGWWPKRQKQQKSTLQKSALTLILDLSVVEV